MEVINTIPVFRVYDMAKAQEFCIDFLGFSIDGVADWNGHMSVQVSRPGSELVLRLTEGEEGGCPSAGVIIDVQSGLKEFYREIVSNLLLLATNRARGVCKQER